MVIECLGDGLNSDMGNFGGKWLFVSFGLSDRGWWPGSKGKGSFVIVWTRSDGKIYIDFSWTGPKNIVAL